MKRILLPIEQDCKCKLCLEVNNCIYYELNKEHECLLEKEDLIEILKEEEIETI